MSDTPRTDEALDAAQESGDPAFHLSNLCYTLETENATLKARIAELEANARTDEILLEASQEATKRQTERVEAIVDQVELEAVKLRVRIAEMTECMQKIVALDDHMKDPRNEDSGTQMGAYYAYYKGEWDTWDKARALLKGDRA